MHNMIKARIITEKYARALKIAGGGGMEKAKVFSASGKIGSQKAEKIYEHDIKTGEKKLIYKKGWTTKNKNLKKDKSF